MPGPERSAGAAKLTRPRRAGDAERAAGEASAAAAAAEAAAMRDRNRWEERVRMGRRGASEMGVYRERTALGFGRFGVTARGLLRKLRWRRGRCFWGLRPPDATRNRRWRRIMGR